MVNDEVLIQIGEKIIEIVNVVTKYNVPLCFHCGKPYIKDEKYCSGNSSVWKPDCRCLSTSTVRIVL